jgi:hypothetical protein
MWTVLLSVLGTKWAHQSWVRAPAHTCSHVLERPETEMNVMPSTMCVGQAPRACPSGAFYRITTEGLQAGISCRNPSSYRQSLANTKAKGKEEDRAGTGVSCSVHLFNSPLCLSSLCPEKHVRFCRRHQMCSLYFLMWDPMFSMFLPPNFTLYFLPRWLLCLV